MNPGARRERTSEGVGPTVALVVVALGFTLLGLLQLSLIYARWRSFGGQPGALATGLISVFVCGLLAHALWRGSPFRLLLWPAWIGFGACVAVEFAVGAWPSVGSATQLVSSIAVLVTLLRWRTHAAKRDDEARHPITRNERGPT
jgi:hypothetical protein